VPLNYCDAKNASSQREYRPYRKIDAANDEYERHPDCDKNGRRNLVGNGFESGRRKEVCGLKTKEANEKDEHHDQTKAIFDNFPDLTRSPYFSRSYNGRCPNGRTRRNRGIAF
jgi:hypothetical protein